MIPDLDKELQEVARFFNTELPTDAGSLGLAFIEENFQQEAFDTGTGANKWAPRKNDPDSGQSRDNRRALLVASGEMKNSFDFNTLPGKVVFYNDVEYTIYHNEGTDKLPQRQMMGPSAKLDADLEDLIELRLNKIFS
jgi:hypothetical protein